MGRSLAGELAVRDGLVLVPLHPARLRERGYNQSMEIALGLAEVLGLPIYAGALQRCKNTRQPALLPAAGRRENLYDAFTPAGAVPLGILPWGRGRCVDDGGGYACLCPSPGLRAIVGIGLSPSRSGRHLT